MNERLTWDEIIDELLKKFKSSQNYDYSIIKKEIEKFKDRIADDDYCKLLKWTENNFGETKNNKGTFGANFVDLIRFGFFFRTKNLMGSFAESVIGDIAECERKKMFLESLKFQLEYKDYEKRTTLAAKIKNINNLKLDEDISKALKDESKNTLKYIVNNVSNKDKKDDIIKKIKEIYKNDIEGLKIKWTEAINKIFSDELKKLKKDIDKIASELENCNNKIKERLGDSFLRDNLLYFKKSDAENHSKK